MKWSAALTVLAFSLVLGGCLMTPEYKIIESRDADQSYDKWSLFWSDGARMTNMYTKVYRDEEYVVICGYYGGEDVAYEAAASAWLNKANLSLGERVVAKTGFLKQVKLQPGNEYDIKAPCVRTMLPSSDADSYEPLGVSGGTVRCVDAYCS